MYVIADTHGNCMDLYYKLDMIDKEQERYDTIFICGDVGLEYGEHVQGQMKKMMASKPYTFIVMRGNHDERYWKNHFNQNNSWYTEEWCGTEVLVQKKYPNIKYLKDEGGTFTYNGMKCLFIPGGYSVDKDYRISRNWPWCPDEKLTYSEMDNLIQIAETEKIDVVFSHTAPLSWQPKFEDMFLSFIDQSTVDKFMEKGLDEIFYKVKENNPNFAWYFGHFHGNRVISEPDDSWYAEMIYGVYAII